MNKILHDLGVVEVVRSEESADGGYHGFLVYLRLATGRKEIDFVNLIVKPMFLVQETYPEQCAMFFRKEWVLREVNNAPEVLFGYVVEVVLSEDSLDIIDVIEKELYMAIRKVAEAPPPQPQKAAPRVVVQPTAEPQRPAVGPRPPMTDENRTKSILDLPDPVIERPLPGDFGQDRNRPNMIPSKYPELSGTEFIVGAGVSGVSSSGGKR